MSESDRDRDDLEREEPFVLPAREAMALIISGFAPPEEETDEPPSSASAGRDGPERDRRSRPPIPPPRSP